MRSPVELAYKAEHRLAVRFDDVVCDLAIERIAQREQLHQAATRIGRLQHRPIAAAVDTLPEGLRLGVKINHGTVLLESRSIGGAHHCAPAGREHDVLQARELLDHCLFPIAKGRFTLHLEYRGNGDAESALELLIRIDEALAEAARKLPAERRLARAHQADKKQIAPMQRHSGIVLERTRVPNARRPRTPCNARGRVSVAMTTVLRSPCP